MIEIAFLLLMRTAPDLPAATATDDSEIVVMARKSNRWRGSWTTVNGATTCRTEVSSGDVAIDAIGCTNLLVCGPPNGQEMADLVRAAQAAGRIRTREDGRRAALPAIKKIERCMDTRWRPALRDL
jgi:hypothetical protein